MLGQVLGPVHHQDHQPHPQRRGPAYQRRQERRQAARAATEVTATEISASDDLPAAKASNASDTEEDDKTDKSEDNVSAEQVKEKFSFVILKATGKMDLVFTFQGSIKILNS